jgi:hydroxymethylpyrimidine/phosphomethylpyrimidine kinase
MEPPVVISIAGSDNSAGAGIQADLKTFTYFKVFGQTVVTCVVAEVPGRVAALHPIDPETVRVQLELSLEYFPVRAIKTGMLYSAQIIQTICHVLESLPAKSRPRLVVDPVMVATSGDPLLEPAAIAAYRTLLIPLASVVTPNIDEACALTKRTIKNVAQLEEAGRALAKEFNVPFLVKGGHLTETEAVDVLFLGESLKRFSAPRKTGLVTHGTGCTLSAAITANLALGKSLEEAVQTSKDYITRAINESLIWKGAAGEVTALKHWGD